MCPLCCEYLTTSSDFGYGSYTNICLNDFVNSIYHCAQSVELFRHLDMPTNSESDSVLSWVSGATELRFSKSGNEREILLSSDNFFEVRKQEFLLLTYEGKMFKCSFQIIPCRK